MMDYETENLGHLDVIYKDGKPDSFVWSGGDVLWVSLYFINILGYEDFPDVLIAGQYKLKKLHSTMNFFRGEIQYIRIDRKFDWFRIIFYKSRHFLKDVNRKILWTLLVWELTDNVIGEEPSWSNVKLFRWLKEKFGD